MFTVIAYTAKVKKLKAIKRLSSKEAVNAMCAAHKRDAVIVMQDGVREPVFRNRLAAGVTA